VLTTADEHIALPHGMLSGSDLEIFSRALSPKSSLADLLDEGETLADSVHC
jgi:hypothetical protein